MKKIIFRKLLKDYLIFLLIAIVSASTIIWVFQAINFLDIITEDGRGYKVYVFYSLLNFPKIIGKILPFAIFFSLFYVIINYEQNNQLMIFWNFGIDKMYLINFFLKFSFFLLLIQLLITALITPFSQEIARSLYRTSSVNFLDDFIKEKKFNDLLKNFTIHAENKDKEGNLKNIYIKKNLGVNNFEITYAKRGIFVNNADEQILILYDGENISGNNDQITNFSFSQSNINLSDYDSETIKVIKTQENSTLNLFKCYFKLKNIKIINLEKNFETRNCSKENLSNIFQEIYKRIFIPFYIPSLILSSLLLIVSSKEDVNYFKKKIAIFLMGFFLIIIYETTIRFIKSSLYENIYLFLMPFIILLSLYLLILHNLNFNKKLNK